jgi:hypothetical protein
MNRKITAIVITLALLTLGCLVLVSNLVGGKRLGLNSARLDANPKLSTAPPARSPAAGSASGRTEDEAAVELADAQARLGRIAAAVEAGDWPGAKNLFADFGLKVGRLPAPQLHNPDVSPVLQDFFDLYSVNLDRALADEDARRSRLALNQLLGIVGEQRARFGVRGVPPEVNRLRFLAREVELWREASDERMVRVRLNALNEAWQSAAPLIRARRDGAAAVKELEPVVARLLAPESEPHWRGLTAELNRGLDRVEGLFQRTPRQAGAADSRSDEE